MGGACSTYGKRKGSIQTQSLARKPEGKRPLKTPKRGFEDNIKSDFKK
jgi:hypothetical protein